MTSICLLPHQWQRCLAAAGIVTFAALIRLLTMQSFGMRAPYLTFYPAVMLAALYGGFPAGILAAILSTLMAAYWWIEPAGRLIVRDPQDWIGIAVFLASCTLISCITEALHRARTRAGKAELQFRLAAEQERAEAVLQRYRLLSVSSRDIILFIRRDNGLILEANAAAAQAYGYSHEELLALSFRDIRAPDTLATADADMAKADDRGHLFETVHVRRDGSRFPVEVSSQGTTIGDDRILISIVRDITERKQKELELLEKNAELERFTYMVSHDLKSPLVTIKTFLGYLDQDLADSDAARIAKDMHFMHTAADRMERMLGELLELSRVGRTVNAPQACTFRELVEAALNMVAGRIAEQGVEVLVGDGDIALYGDCARLLEIWQNLLENACKFMGDQAAPRIEIGARGSGQQTLFFVADNGIGIEAQHQEKIFGLFEKLDRNMEGSGLGLALVKRIVELNGGKIRVESQGPGQGACFSFTLPGAVKDSLNGENR